jgi:hypothetical protein
MRSSSAISASPKSISPNPMPEETNQLVLCRGLPLMNRLFSKSYAVPWPVREPGVKCLALCLCLESHAIDSLMPEKTQLGLGLQWEGVPKRQRTKSGVAGYVHQPPMSSHPRLMPSCATPENSASLAGDRLQRANQENSSTRSRPQPINKKLCSAGTGQPCPRGKPGRREFRLHPQQTLPQGAREEILS